MFGHGSDVFRICHTSLNGRVDYPCSDWLGKYHDIAGLGAGFKCQFFRVDYTGNRKPVFKFLIFHTVSPQQNYLCLFELVQSAAQYLPQDRDIHRFNGETNQIHGCDGFTAHGIHIAEGIGGSYLPESVGVVNDRGKEIDGLDDGQIIGYFIYPGIVGAFQPDYQVRVGSKFQPAKGFVQVPWPEF